MDVVGWYLIEYNNTEDGMSITDFAGSVRRARGLPQAVVAARAGEAVPNLSIIENGRRSPSAAKLDRILRASGARLLPAPTTRAGALEASADIRRSVLSNDQQGAFRAWLSYNDALAAEDAVNRVVLSAFPPEPTGSALYDAALAAVTEFRLAESSAPIPAWVDETAGLDDPEILADSSYVRSVDPNLVAAPFLRRGVLFDQSSLASV